MRIHVEVNAETIDHQTVYRKTMEHAGSIYSVQKLGRNILHIVPTTTPRERSRRRKEWNAPEIMIHFDVRKNLPEKISVIQGDRAHIVEVKNGDIIRGNEYVALKALAAIIKGNYDEAIMRWAEMNRYAAQYLFGDGKGNKVHLEITKDDILDIIKRFMESRRNRMIRLRQIPLDQFM